MIRSALAIVLAAAFAVPSLMQPAAAQPKGKAEKVDKKAAGRKEVKGRLPAHYSKIVDDAQRDRIYRIQAKYSARIEALQAQLDTLQAERDAEIRAVLTPEQQDQLDTLVTDAKAARAEKAAQKTKETKRNIQQARAVKNKKAKQDDK
jgi:Spy/CpxP family protein refolding chaperone